MAIQTVVRYTTRDEAAAELNQQLIEAVFAELARVRPEGFRYGVSRPDAGLSFVHAAVFEGDANPLLELESFRAFSSSIGERVVEPPVVATGPVVASYP
jgi:hypothetical protein